MGTARPRPVVPFETDPRLTRHGPDEDLRTAWRNRLAREGKLNAENGSVADLVLGRAESH